MPGRQSHGGPPTKAPKTRSKKKNRAINAFAIAAQQLPENVRIRQTRLGESEGGNRPLKRGREPPNDRDEEEDKFSAKRQKKALKGRFDELDIDEGSDSEGNEWRMGDVDEDNDSDLDSDEAFGESDEEKFEGFAFSGSTEKGKNGSTTKRSQNVIALDEDEVDGDSESGEESLGEDAIDLAAMLDATEGDEEGNENDEQCRSHETDEAGETDGHSSAPDDESEDESSTSSTYSEDDNDPEKVAALQDLIANLPQSDRLNGGPKKHRHDGAIESHAPSEFGVTSRAKLTLEDLGLPSVKDPYVKKSLKLLEAETKGTKQSGRLDVPLAKRQQDRLDRGVAYDKSKETLERWTDTVKHNRRADHLSFPLPDADASSLNANSRLKPTNSSKPFNDLEATIQNILEESGLGTADGKDDEDKLLEFEELETKKMSLEEVKARRDQLRIVRDLMFREETRAKRIKKIKSKSYRRVHRKDREKEDRINKQALIDAGIDPSEDEQEAQDRRRAMERMGSRHRDSKWAKANKETGRAAWDEDARAGITEMARRDEELRKRVDGRTSRNDGSDSSGSMSEFGNDSDVEDEDLEGRKLQRKLDGADLEIDFSNAGPGVKLSNMKFMLKAEAARRKENDETVAQIRKELAGEDSQEETELLEDVGRRTFGPGTGQGAEVQVADSTRNSEFEELDWSDEEPSGEPAENTSKGKQANNKAAAGVRRTIMSRPAPEMRARKQPAPISSTTPVESSHETGAWSKIGSKTQSDNPSDSRRRKQKLSSSVVEELDLTNAAMIAKRLKEPKKQQPKQSSTVLLVTDDESSEADDAVHLPFAIRDQELIKRAFAGADVVGEFEAEKRQTIEDEDEKIVDSTLPGWGNWVGEGLSKREKARNKGRFLTKTEGIKEQNRKDAKLERVIINEKHVKKNGKYLASSLPHPFETKQQYERSLRLPVGPEWTTKETFQDVTKPRILLKQGVIAPMSKPLL